MLGGWAWECHSGCFDERGLLLGGWGGGVKVVRAEARMADARVALASTQSSIRSSVWRRLKGGAARRCLWGEGRA